MDDIKLVSRERNADELLDLPEVPQKKRIRDINGGIVMCMLGIILLLLGARDGHLLVFGQLVTAKIINSEPRSSNPRPSTYDVYYSFNMSGNWHKGCFISRPSDSDLSMIIPGKKIEIRAIPDNPNFSKPISKVNTVYTLLKLLGGLACFGFAAARFRGKLV